MKGLLRGGLVGMTLLVVPTFFMSATGPTGGANAQSEDEMRQLTSTILLGLGADPIAQPEPEEVDPEMREMTNSVLAGLGLSSAKPEEVPEGVDGLSVLITQAISQGQSDAYLEALLEEAVGVGLVSVPAELKTAEGEVDTKTLLSSIVAKAEARTEGAVDTPSEAVPLLMVRGKQYYVVEKGDSLGGIAFRIYGRTSEFQRIFEANKDKLKSPDRIVVGQRLLIPKT
ncbi:MAG: LysM peptidoglycan-binding domain-containing protein [Brevirhabdus sp.]